MFSFSQASQFARDLMVIALFASPMFFCAPQVQAKEPKAVANPIEIVGKTADGKFNVYRLEGAIDGERWTSNGRTYNGEDLTKRMPFLKKEDIAGLECAFVCKTKGQQVVGLNPGFAWLYAKK